MTTNFLDNKICHFKILLSWRFPQRKTAFWTIFLSAPKASPPSKAENFIFIVVSLSLKLGRALLTRSGMSHFYASTVAGAALPERQCTGKHMHDPFLNLSEPKGSSLGRFPIGLLQKAQGGAQKGVVILRRESSGGTEWAGGMELHFFRALNFQISEPEIWQKSLFLRNLRDFPENFGL